MLREPEGLAAKAIVALGVSPEAAREALIAALPPGIVAGRLPGDIPFAPRAKKVLEQALREALALGHNYIGTEHILLGVLQDEESLGGGALAGLGITAGPAREWLVAEIDRITAAKRQFG